MSFQSVAQLRNNFLRDQYFVAAFAVLAFGEAIFSAGGGNCGVNDFLVAQLRNNFLRDQHFVAAFAMLAFGEAIFSAGGGNCGVNDFLVAQ